MYRFAETVLAFDDPSLTTTGHARCLAAAVATVAAPLGVGFRLFALVWGVSVHCVSLLNNCENIVVFVKETRAPVFRCRTAIRIDAA